MTDKQIFENEIKCITRRNECVCNGGSDCVKCDLLMDSEEIVKCYNRAIKNIDLINCQKAEIERLKKRNTLLLKKKCKDINTARKIIKSEAIKEFVKRLKEKLQWDVEFTDKLVFESDIDNLVKEMTEVQK